MVTNRLKELRKERGLTLKKLSTELAKTGVKAADGQLSFWENGTRAPRKNETWEKIASFFGVSTSYLLGYSNVKNGYEYTKNAHKLINEEDEGAYNSDNEDYDDEYFDNKRFIADMEGALIDKIGEDDLKRLKKQIFNVYLINELSENEKIATYAGVLEGFLHLSLGLLDNPNIDELSQFETDILDLNIKYYLLTEGNRIDLMKYLDFMMSKQDNNI
ncbi:helix-turn-helix domain-containing protein [Lactovum odontotermitis]